MEIGISAKDDGDVLRGEDDQRIVDLALPAAYKGTGKRNMEFGKGSELE